LVTLCICCCWNTLCSQVVQEELKPPKPIVSKEEQAYFRSFHGKLAGVELQACALLSNLTDLLACLVLRCLSAETHIAPRIAAVEQHPRVNRHGSVPETSLVMARNDGKSETHAMEATGTAATGGGKHDRRATARSKATTLQRSKVPCSNTELFKSLLAAQDQHANDCGGASAATTLARVARSPKASCTTSTMRLVVSGRSVQTRIIRTRPAPAARSTSSRAPSP